MQPLPEPLFASSLLIKGGQVVDALGSRRADVLVRDGKVVDVGTDLNGDQVIEASGCVVSPGFVDLHVHLREPGDEEAETIETGTRAAARGGFTAVVAMPNTRPALDDAAVVSSVLALGKEAGLCDVVSSGCITVARAGEQLAPMGELYALGVRIFTDDGFCVASAGVMRRGAPVRRVAAGRDRRPARRGRDPRRRRAHARGRVVEPARHPRAAVGRGDGDRRPRHRAVRGHRHPGALPALLGRGHRRPRARGEGALASRSPRSARRTTSRSPTSAVRASTRCSRCTRRCARRPTSRRSARVWPTAPSTPSPPTTRHTPPNQRSDRSRRRPRACSGWRPRSRSRSPSSTSPLVDALALLSWRPAAIAGLDDHGGPIVPGAPANLTVFDPSHEWVVEPSALASRARNTPFAGRTLKGKVRHTILFGDVVVRDGEATR